MKGFQLIIFFSLAPLLFSCFEFDENFVDIQVPDERVLEADFSLSNDTIYIRESTRIFFGLSQSDNITSYSIFLGEELIFTNDGTPFSISINPNNYTTGHHILRLEILKKTNSGSLADELGVEHFVQSFENVITIDNEPLIAPQLQMSINASGHLDITWPEYTGFKFDKYQIDVSGYPSFIIGDAADTKITIEDYVGQMLYVGSAIFAKEESTSELFEFAYDFEFEIKRLSDSQIQVEWIQPPFQAITEFEVSIKDTYSDTEMVNTIQTSPGNYDEVIDFTSAFPYEFEATLASIRNAKDKLITGRTEIQAPIINENTNLGTDFSFSVIEYIHITENNQVVSLYLENGGVVSNRMKLEDFDGNELIRINGKFTITPDRKRIFGMSYNSSGARDVLHITEYDVNTLNIVEEYDIELGFFSSSLNHIYASNDGFLYLIYNGGRDILFNWNSKETLTNSGFRFSESTLHNLSNEGKYLYRGESYYDVLDERNIREGLHNTVAINSVDGNSYLRKVATSPQKMQERSIPDNAVIKEYISKPNREIKWAYSNQNGYFGLVTFEDGLGYFFEIYSSNNSTDMIQEVKLNLLHTDLDDFRNIRFDGNYLIISGVSHENFQSKDISYVHEFNF